jgi:hypothetical protein
VSLVAIPRPDGFGPSALDHGRIEVETGHIEAVLASQLDRQMTDVGPDSLEWVWIRQLGFALWVIGFVSVPIAIGIAVFKYRLYEIDLIINRTLVYGLLTVVLVLVYFGGVTATQTLFRYLTGQQSTLAIVTSTLLIAALFNPVRQRIQAFIDRRFYRRKYNARKTLQTFSVKLRDETDLEALNAELIEVVRETMQPA